MTRHPYYAMLAVVVVVHSILLWATDRALTPPDGKPSGCLALSVMVLFLSVVAVAAAWVGRMMAGLP